MSFVDEDAVKDFVTVFLILMHLYIQSVSITGWYLVLRQVVPEEVGDQ